MKLNLIVVVIVVMSAFISGVSAGNNVKVSLSKNSASAYDYGELIEINYNLDASKFNKEIKDGIQFFLHVSKNKNALYDSIEMWNIEKTGNNKVYFNTSGKDNGIYYILLERYDGENHEIIQSQEVTFQLFYGNELDPQTIKEQKRYQRIINRFFKFYDRHVAW